ncbi:MAG: glycosyltransferase family 39 protein [bacterium]|nr:glycosyltransferase family 39 protein [bacterium]
MKKYLSIFLPFLIVISVLSTVWVSREAFLKKYDPNYWQSQYENSEWAKGWDAPVTIGDADLYAYAGWRQINGDDPTKINPEMPPLGKYFLGLSILIFNNQNLPSLFFGLVLLMLTYLISKAVLGEGWLKFVPVFLLSYDTLFRENLSISMLDMPLAAFTALAFYFLILAQKKPRLYFLAAASLGAVASTKMYLAGFALTGAVFAYLLIISFLFRRKNVLWFLISIPAFLLVYFGSYSIYFLKGHNLLDFKYLHFWVRHFARVDVTNYPQFEIFRILLLGRWKTWWGGSGIVSANVWNPLWTAGLLVAFFVAYFGLKEKKHNVLLLIVWIFSYLAMYSVGVPYPRYLLPILPAIYIILIFGVEKLSSLSKWKYLKNIKT